MRKLALGIFLLALLAPGEAQTRTLPKQSTVEQVKVIRSADNIQVQIETRGQITPNVTTLDSPSRLVVGLPGTAMATSYNHINIGSGNVKALRIGTDDRTPPNTRVVIDCVETCKYKILSVTDSRMIVQLDAARDSTTRLPIGKEAPSRVSNPQTSSGLTRTAASTPPAEAAATPLYPEKTVPIGRFNGPGSCAASSCHGSVQPKTNTSIFQNEYTIWIGQDKHARSFSVLQNNISERMGRILDIGSPAKAPKCLACHALFVPPDQQARTFELGDGVSCENCHGPASGWLGPHTTKGWQHEKSVQLGMYDMRNLQSRSERCLTCHLGTAEKFVDHEMIAAGHPDLTFELGVFTSVMPPHWKTPEQRDPWRQVQAIVVGQAMQLRQSLNRLARRARSDIWPEYSELDCFACHHSLTRPEDSWRQARGYSGRRSGDPTWNESRFIIFQDVVREISPGASKQLEEQISQVAHLMNQLNGNREQISAAAVRASASADQLLKQLNSEKYDSSVALRLMRQISADGPRIAREGERTAEQAAMTIDSLFRAYSQTETPANGPDLRSAIDGLVSVLQDPSAYSAPRFAARMERVREIANR